MNTELTQIINSLWYESMVDDCKAIITEAVFNSRWELIVGYHELGKRIVTDSDYQRHANGNGKICKTLAEDIGQSERTLYYAIQFYTKFPDLTKLPDGKNISWTKITALLPDGKWTEARSFEQRKGTLRQSLDKFMSDFPDMPPDIKRRILDLLALFDVATYSKNE